MLFPEVSIGWTKLSALNCVCTKGMNTIAGV